MPEHTLLVAAADARQRTYLADQLITDGHAVDIADSRASLQTRENGSTKPKPRRGGAS
jgi:hypothetical protein